MCDYSLVSVPNRLAVRGEELVVYRFEAESVGLASALDVGKARQRRRPRWSVWWSAFWSAFRRLLHFPDTSSLPAVCIPPGARLLVRDIPARLQYECGFLEAAEEAVFTQISAIENTYRDAVRFQNGVVVLLQRLTEGQRVRVLDLSSAEDEPTIPSGRRAETITRSLI